MIKIALIILGVVALILIVTLFLLSSPKHHFFISLGIVGVVSGFSAFSTKSLNLDLGNFEILRGLTDSIVQTMFNSFLFILVFGAILLVIGFIWAVFAKKSAKSSKSSRSRKG